MSEQQICVLLVEDDRSVRRYLEVTLQRAGYKVITAEDGLAGMKCALTDGVDVVLTDAIMPQMSGRELARFLKNTPKLAKLPIVLLTGQEAHHPGSQSGITLYCGFESAVRQLQRIRKSRVGQGKCRGARYGTRHIRDAVMQ